MLALRRDHRLESEEFCVVDFHFDPFSNSEAVMDFASKFLALSLDARLSAPIYDTRELHVMINTGELSTFVDGAPPEPKPFSAYVSARTVECGYLIATCRKLAASCCLKDVFINGASVCEVGE